MMRVKLFQSVDMTIRHKIHRQVSNDDKDRIVTGILILLRTTALFPGNNFFGHLDAKVASQLNSDNLRNVGQAFMISSTFSQPSRIFALMFWAWTSFSRAHLQN